MSAISYARIPVVRPPASDDETPMWSAAIPLEVALAAEVAPKSAAIHALVNHGRWVVSCPDCASAQLACPSDRRFMCHECANIAIGVRWRPVLWPKDPAALSDALAGRTDRALQNLDPGETVEQVLEQNAVLADHAAGYAAAVAAGEDHPGGFGLHAHHPGKASLHEGHTHEWPKSVKPDQVYVCKTGCDLELTGLAIDLSRREGNR